MLSTLDLECDLTAKTVAGPGVGVEFPDDPMHLRFFLVEKGRCWVEVEGAGNVLLEAGDFVLIRPGLRVRTRSEIDAPVRSIHDWMAEIQLPCRSGLIFLFGGPDYKLEVISGRAHVRDAATHPLLRALPPIALIRAKGGDGTAAIAATLAMIQSETVQPTPGTRPIIDRMLEVAIMQAMRIFARERAGWFAAMQDPDIGRVVALILDRPQLDWSLESMASEAGVSRSTFADRFRKIVGQTPMAYLTQWRMHVAIGMLRDRGSRVGEVAMAVGYESEAAFSRAFRKHLGISPGSARQLGVVAKL